MADTIAVTCPACGKALNVPAGLAGKTIRCKDCKATFAVPAPRAKTARPVPSAGKPVKPAAKTTRPADVIPFKDDPPAPTPPAPDLDDDANPYGIVKDDSEVPRCPFCAKELETPDDAICLHCGFHLKERKRRETKAVYEATTEDYVSHLGPAVGCVVGLLLLWGLDVYAFLNMRDWLTGSLVDLDTKNAITGNQEFIVGPLCFNLWIGVISAGLTWVGGKYAFKRLVYEFTPPERVIKR